MKPVKYNPFLHIHPALKKEMLKEFEQFYDDQSYILGSGLEKFEREYADFNEVNFAVGVGNGHDAQLIALKCLDIGSEDEVIIPAHTFVATALAVVNAGAKPVLVDIDLSTLNVHPGKIEDKITGSTKAIIPVHLYGNPCDMNSIQSIAMKHDLHLIEDNAQAQGAEFQEQKTGSLGIINFTSFYPTKNIGALGDGGMITTDNEELAQKARILRNYGKTRDGTCIIAGYNSRLDELQARILSIKLQFLDEWNTQRIEIARIYESRLMKVEEIQLQQTHRNTKNVRHIFPIITNKRDELKTYLQSKGIETLIHYEKPIHLHKSLSFLSHDKGSFPNAEKICQEQLSLPIYPGLKEDEIKYVCEEIKNFFKKS